MEKIKVLLADDHAVVRGGTKLIIENEADMIVVGEAKDGEELLQQAQLIPYDVAIVDVNMPRLNGIKAAQQLKQLNPAARVLIMTGYNNESYVQICQDNAIDGFLLKERSPLELVTTIRMLAMGHQVFPKQDKSHSHNLTRLTERERHIIRLVSEGSSNKEIAHQLNITERTVEYHLGNLYGKLEVSTRAEAVKKTIDMGLLVDL
jgi:DNA-binding NarL/FixJ family response regulator